VSCGKKKKTIDGPVALGDLYTRHQTKLKIKLARLMTTPDEIYVISGKLGLVSLDSKSINYDSGNRLPDTGLVKKQVQENRIRKGVYIGQKKYYNFLKKFIPGLHNLIVARNSQDFCFRVKQLIEAWEE